MSLSVLVGAGPFEGSDEFYLNWIRQGDLNIAVDGGIKLYHHLNIVPDVFLGDFDSSQIEEKNWADKKNVPTYSFPCDKDATDMKLALDYAFSQNITDIILLDELGGRLDHSLANIFLLKYAWEKGTPMKIISPNHIVQLLMPDQSILVEHRGIISLIIVSEMVTGLHMQGFRWNVSNETVKMGSTLNISNYLIEKQGTISIHSGMAFLIFEFTQESFRKI
ncbi:MAG TPA: thiamine diphosphokinase [Planctomycetota bacterium]|nr:thiamine diphosphokinase [Planctomycetota bacterium]